MFRFLGNLTLILSLALLGSTSLAQSPTQDLRGALPADSLLVLGMQDIVGIWDDLDDFRVEFERLGVGEALAELFGDEMMETLELEDDLEVLDLLGQDAWLSLSASSFSPLPAVTAVARLETDAMVAMARAIGETSAQDGAEAMSEGDYSFFVTDLDDPDSPFQVLAYGQAGDLVYLSTNPDTLRGLLRRLGGASEEGFAVGAGSEGTFGTLEDGNFYLYLDYGAVGRLAQPFAAGMGFDAAVNRLAQALDTLGVVASVVRFTENGVETESVQRLNPQGGDSSLLALLTGGGTPPDATTLVPAEALSYSSSATNLRAWWDYLNELSRSIPELGGDLNSLILSFTGLDLNRTLFSWMGEGLVTVVTGFGDLTEPGVASSNLLGDQVFLIASADEEAAQRNLEEFFTTVAMTLSAFTDPMGEATPEASQREIGGVNVNLFAVSEGITVAYAVADGYAMIATSAEAIEDVLAARADGQALAGRAGVAELLATVPEEASSVSYVDNAANLTSLASQLRSQLQLTAGLTGSADLDFEAVTAAGDALENFLLFVAERLGPGVGFSLSSPEGSYSYGFTPVRW